MPLKQTPHKVTEDFWWYEEGQGISVVVVFRSPDGEVLDSKVRNIPWRSIRAALKRKDEK